MKRKLAIVSASKGKFEDSLLSQSKHLQVLCEKNRENRAHLFTVDNNTQPLAKVYNAAVKEISRRGECNTVVFMHDDVTINCSDLDTRIDEALDKFDVIGVAGNRTAEIKSPALWHLMTTPDKLAGAAAHIKGDTYQITSFGPLNVRALMIDGVFIAARLDKLPDKPFDESCPAGFHFYDLDFSLNCNANKLKLGVWDIPIIHASPGLAEITQEWRDGEKWFLSKWL
tara:strand:+ start:6175 stop:6855 length:681 start_codon:yes stop_codon:yes gene_type:complete